MEGLLYVKKKGYYGIILIEQDIIYPVVILSTAWRVSNARDVFLFFILLNSVYIFVGVLSFIENVAHIFATNVLCNVLIIS